MLNLLDNVDPADIIAFARAVPTPEDFTLTREIVPNTEIQNVKYRIRNMERRVNAAKFRAYDAETPFGRREVEHQTLEGFLPPIGDAWTVGELETILLAMERGADDGDLVDAIYDDVSAHVLAIRARMELAAGDLLTDGVFSLVDENKLTLEADFTVDPAFLPTASVFWSDPTALILDDLQAWTRQLVKEGSGRPGDALTSFEVISWFARNAQIKGDFYGEADGTNRPTLTPGQVQTVLQSRGIPAIREYDTQVRVDGANVRVTPENRFFLLPGNKDTFAQTQYGITAEALALSRQGNPRIEREDQPGIIVTAGEQDNPVRVFTKGSAVAMPVLYDNKGYISAQVLA